MATHAYYATTTATATTAGGVAGYRQAAAIRQGETGTPVPQETWAYFTTTAGGGPSSRWPRTRPTATPTAPAAETTELRLHLVRRARARSQSVTTTLPAVTAAENGPGTRPRRHDVYDAYGRPVWRKDADGFLTYTAYDPATGAVVKTIADVNTADDRRLHQPAVGLVHAGRRRAGPDHARTRWTAWAARPR